MLRRDGVRRDSAGPPARRRPKTPSPSVTPAGVGGPRAAESREPPRRRGGRAAERRLRDPCPPAPPPRGAPAPPGPGSQEASLPRPADQLRCRAGAGVMEETPPPPVWADESRRAAGGGEGAGSERGDRPGSTPAPCRGKCASGWGGASAPPPGRARAGCLRRALAAASGISPHVSPVSHPPGLPPRSPGVAGDPMLTEKAAGLEERRTSGHSSSGANCVSLSLSAPQFTLFHPPPASTPLAVIDP